MLTLEKIEKNTIFIIPDNHKDYYLTLLSNNVFLRPFVLHTTTRFLSNLLPEYDLKDAIEISKHFHLSPDLSLEYLKNLPFIDPTQTYQSEKLNTLKKMSSFLNKSDDTIKIYLNYLKSKKIVICKYFVVEPLLISILQKYNLKYEFIDIPQLPLQETKPVVYEFLNLIDEVEYTAYEIANLIYNKMVDPNKIKLINVSSEYHYLIEKIFKMHNIPINLDKKTALYDTIIAKEFLAILKETLDLVEAFEVIKHKHPINNFNNQLFQTMIDIINKYVIFNIDNDVCEFIKHDFKNTFIKPDKYSNGINIFPIDSVFTDDDYVFVIGLIQGIVPKIYRNEDFFSDEEKQKFGLASSIVLTNNSKTIVKNLILTVKNLFLSYCLKSPFSTFQPSRIIQEMKLKVVKYQKNYAISYSSDFDSLKLASIYDSTYQPTANIEAIILHNNYQIDYRGYDNQYKVVTPLKIKKLIERNKLQLSYTSLDQFYECKFKFFLNSILKMKSYGRTEEIDRGNIFHYILSKIDYPDFDFDKEYTNYFKDYISLREEFYISKLKKELKKIIEIIQTQKTYTSLNNTSCEQKFTILFNEAINIPFTGGIDKIMWRKENDKTYLSIIDYKTGNSDDVDLEKVKFGLSMQLPTYMYLIKKTNHYKKPIVCGFYLQKLLHRVNKIGEDYDKFVTSNLKLKGYSTSNKITLEKFDSAYEDSQMISGLKVKKDGNFYNYSKILSESEMDVLCNLIDINIKQAINNIAAAQFEINPKYYKGKNVSCEYCPYKNVCYVKNEDYIYLDSGNEESGDNDE